MSSQHELFKAAGALESEVEDLHAQLALKTERSKYFEDENSYLHEMQRH